MRYRVEVTRTYEWWVIYVPTLDLHTQAALEGDVRSMAVDLIAGMLGLEASSVAVDIVSGKGEK